MVLKRQNCQERQHHIGGKAVTETVVETFFHWWVPSYCPSLHANISNYPTTFKYCPVFVCTEVCLNKCDFCVRKSAHYRSSISLFLTIYPSCYNNSRIRSWTVGKDESLWASLLLSETLISNKPNWSDQLVERPQRADVMVIRKCCHALLCL